MFDTTSGRLEPVAAAKARLRARLVAQRAARDPAAAEAVARELAAVATAAAAVRRARAVAAYVSVGTEPGTRPLLDALRAADVAVALPVVAPGRRLRWAWYDEPTALVAGPFGLLEPAAAASRDLPDVDLLLVPALAVDGRGARLGRGGGYYDRLLAATATPAVAVVHPDEVLDAVPTEPHDVAVAAVLTPRELRWLR